MSYYLYNLVQVQKVPADFRREASFLLPSGPKAQRFWLAWSSNHACLPNRGEELDNPSTPTFGSSRRVPKISEMLFMNINQVMGHLAAAIRARYRSYFSPKFTAAGGGLHRTDSDDVHLPCFFTGTGCRGLQLESGSLDFISRSFWKQQRLNTEAAGA